MSRPEKDAQDRNKSPPLSRTPVSPGKWCVVAVGGVGFVALIMIAFAFDLVETYQSPYSYCKGRTGHLCSLLARREELNPVIEDKTLLMINNRGSEFVDNDQGSNRTGTLAHYSKDQNSISEPQQEVKYKGNHTQRIQDIRKLNKNPLQCGLLQKYHQLVFDSNASKAMQDLPIIQVDGKPSIHVLRLGVPYCGIFYMKISCRPPLSYTRGQQEWPEIVSGFLDKALGFNLAYPAYGFALPTTGFDKMPVRPKCLFNYNGIAFIMGAILRSEKFVDDKKWYMDNCRSKDERFLRDLFKLAIFDYLTLNTDRHMPKNWFREGDRIVAADNGAWSFHDHTQLCDQNRYLRTMLYPIKVFADRKVNGCPWLTKTERPICTLVNKVNGSEELKFLLEDSSSKWIHWRDELLASLSNDRWFQVMTAIGRRRGIRGGKLMSYILSRKMDSCRGQLLKIGVNNESDIQPLHVAKYIVNELENRYILAQRTVKSCLEQN